MGFWDWATKDCVMMGEGESERGAPPGVVPMSRPDGVESTRGDVFQRLDLTASYPYSFGEYARRALWELVQATLIRYSWRRASGWRRFWLRRFGAVMPATAGTKASTRIKHPWLFSMGEHSMIAEGVEVYNLGPVSVGSHTIVSQNAHLCNGTHDYRKPDLPLIRPTMRIGSGVWVCADAFVGPGVEIGNNAVVGARAVVMRSVPPGVVVSGNPARVIRARVMEGLVGAPGGEREGD